MLFQPDDIKTLRQALGLTQAKFASKFSLSRGLVAQWETGKKSPTTDVHKILEQLKKEIPTDLLSCNVNTPGEIKALREALGLTQAALAKKLKSSKSLVKYWEKGKRSPSPFFQAKLKRLALQAKSSENSEGEQNVTSEEGGQNVTSEEGGQNVTSEEQEQIVTSEEQEQIITSE